MKKFNAVVAVIALSFCLQNPVQCEREPTYVVSDFKANWFEAFELCIRSRNGRSRLAVINNQPKDDNLYAAIKASNIYVKGDTFVWIGASDLAKEGAFTWHSTGEPVLYSRWAYNQPDNFEGIEHCTSVGYTDQSYGKTWQWNDRECNAKLFFVCEVN